jgi:hypothetical protein
MCEFCQVQACPGRGCGGATPSAKQQAGNCLWDPVLGPRPQRLRPLYFLRDKRAPRAACWALKCRADERRWGRKRRAAEAMRAPMGPGGEEHRGRERGKRVCRLQIESGVTFPIEGELPGEQATANAPV